ncbi:hypothetical protein V9T40_006237 [Parthenolecanium corni]|uniref:Uncharacterized protein n=1 Tax=Parthenolecanium corni TaxID=536013 RepID=A0AAN9TVG6_9HEMI
MCLHFKRKSKIELLRPHLSTCWLIYILFQYKHYEAQFLSITLQNIQNFFLLSNKVTYTDSMVHAHVHLGLSHPIISAHISYTDGHDSDKKDIHVQYLVEDIYAKLEFHKELSGGKLQLFNVNPT